MTLAELILIAIGLSMDAFSVSICKGLSVTKVRLKHILLCGIYFGFFQGFMPLIGYFVGCAFSSYIQQIDHWIAFALLAYIGISMIKESKEEGELNPDFTIKTMFLLAIATSIDALTIGVTFAFLEVNVWLSSALIAVTTFLFSCAGVLLGHTFGKILGKRAELFGGLVLAGLGIKILVEHLFF